MNILDELFKKQDTEYKSFNERLLPNVNSVQIIGVRVPELRKLSHKCIKENIEITDPYYYEEIMIKGMIIGYKKNSIEGYLKELEGFLPLIDNWAVCDCCCSTYKFANKYQKETWDFISNYINSNDEYKVRFSIVMMLDYFINDEYIDDVLKTLKGIRSEKYYINMAIAWALSVAFIKYPVAVEKIIDEHSLDEWVHNKTIQKIMESYRVSKPDKDRIKHKKRHS